MQLTGLISLSISHTYLDIHSGLRQYYGGWLVRTKDELVGARQAKASDDVRRIRRAQGSETVDLTIEKWRPKADNTGV